MASSSSNTTHHRYGGVTQLCTHTSTGFKMLNEDTLAARYDDASRPGPSNATLT